MGLFPSANDFKAGKGVEKDAPRKTGIGRFFELVGRDMNGMFLANLLTCIGFAPVICLVYIGFLQNSLPVMLGSAAVGGLLAGMKVDCVCPHGYRPAADVLMFAHKYGSAFRLLEDPAEGVKDADVVVTAVWNTAAPGTTESESRLRDFAGFQLTSTLLKAAKPDCMVLHCLPAHRGEEISTAVFEAHADEIFTEAENRLHVQKAVLAVLLAGK